MTAEQIATYVIAVIGCIARRAGLWMAEVLLLLVDVFGISVLLLAIALAWMMA